MRWSFKPKPDPEAVSRLAARLNVDPLIAHLLVQRGITTFDEARRYFRPDWEQLHDPFSMADMGKAVDRILLALREGQPILVYGDYDVDGTSAVALMVSFLRDCGGEVGFYIPDRYKEGYGLSLQGIDFADDNGMPLIIALDCGIKAVEQAVYARARGIDLIICDHHRPGAVLPEALAILDPKRADCHYPFKELCGCGVGFKLIQGVHQNLGRDRETLLPYLDLVAVAIGADIVPITGENRVLTHLGLKVVNTRPRPGLLAMMRGLDRGTYSVSDLVFGLAPRLNAAGRMQHGELAVRLLIESDPQRATSLAVQIEGMNAERRDTDQLITQEALEMIRENGEEDRMSTVVYNPHWHKGVIGIVASRLIETYYRPTLVFTRTGDRLAASARSVRGFDIYQALERCSDCIEQFGGHTYAAGLTLEPERFEEFKARFEAEVDRSIDPGLLTPEIQIDLPVRMDRLTPKLYRILRQFAPFGPGNPRPVFASGPVRDTGYARPVGKEKNHLKLTLQQDDSQAIGAIGFGLGKRHALVAERQEVEVAYCLEENQWQGQKNLQLKVRDIRPWEGSSRPV